MTCSVFFNLDGTLTRHDLDYEAVFTAAITAAGLDELTDSYEQYTDTFFTYFQNGWTFPRRQAILELMADNGIDDTGQSDRFAVAWEDEEAAQTTVVDAADSVVNRLADRYKLGIVTNGTGRLQRLKLENNGLIDAFSVLLISSEIGIVKPSPTMFEEAQQALAADTHVIVSHDIRRDLIPAKKQGFSTVWVADSKSDQRVAQIVDQQVASLDGVEDAVNELCG